VGEGFEAKSDRKRRLNENKILPRDERESRKIVPGNLVVGMQADIGVGEVF